MIDLAAGIAIFLIFLFCGSLVDMEEGERGREGGKEGDER